MDAYLAIVSKRDEKQYADRPIPDDVVRRILDAGRLAGSATNRQPWRFLVLESRDVVERVAEMVYAPRNVLTATLVVAIATDRPAAFDVGRAAQNMMLAGWNEGVTSSPNGTRDAEATRRELGLGGDERVQTILSFGYPASGRDAGSRSPQEWSRGARRKRLDDVVRRL